MKSTILILLILTGFVYSQKSNAQSNASCNIETSFAYTDTSNCEIYFYPLLHNSTDNYLWKFGDGSTSNQAFAYYSYNNYGSYNVTLIVSNDTCVDSLTQTITVQPCNSPCPIDASFSHTNTTGNTYDFSPNVFDASYNYHWIFGDGTTSTDAYSTHTFTNENDYFVTLVVSNCNCSNSETVTITISDSSNCAYDGTFTYTQEADGSFTFTPNHQSPNYNYYWNFGDGSSTTDIIPNYTYLTDSNYIVSLNVWEPNNDLCSDTTYQNVQVLNSPGCQLNSSFTTWIDSITNITYFYPSIYNSSYDYEWDFGDGHTSNYHSPSHTYTANGVYLVKLTIYLDTCQNSDSIYNTMMTMNLNPLDETDFELNIFPNPASEFITLEFNSINSKKIDITLIDMNGRLINKNRVNLSKGENQEQINIQTLSQGMYQIVLREEDGRFIQRTKFIKK